MSTIEQELILLNSTKNAIKNSIENKGVTVGSIPFANYPAKIAEIEGGSSGLVIEKDVNFYDYDGTLLFSYTTAEAQALTTLPTNANTNPRLTFQDWTHTLAEVNAVVRKLDVGAMYEPTSGYTEIDYTITKVSGGMPTLRFTNTSGASGKVVWGDGQETEFGGTGVKNIIPALDIAEGSYILRIETEGTYSFINTSSNLLFGEFNYRYCITNVFLSKNTTLGTMSFAYCYSLKTISIPQEILTFDIQLFLYAYSIQHINIPRGVSIISQQVANYTYNLSKVVMPNTITRFGNHVFHLSYILYNIVIPPSLTDITASSFVSNFITSEYDFTRHTFVPTLVYTNAFTNINPICKIYVPLALYDEWIAATNWSTYADYIVGV